MLFPRMSLNSNYCPMAVVVLRLKQRTQSFWHSPTCVIAKPSISDINCKSLKCTITMFSKTRSIMFWSYIDKSRSCDILLLVRFLLHTAQQPKKGNKKTQKSLPLLSEDRYAYLVQILHLIYPSQNNIRSTPITCQQEADLQEIVLENHDETITTLYFSFLCVIAVHNDGTAG